MAKKIGAIKDLVDLKAIIDGFVIDEEDRPAAFYEVKGGMNTMTAAEQALNNAMEAFKQAFNTLKPGEEVQIIVQGKPYKPNELILNYNSGVDIQHPIDEYKRFYPNFLDDYLTTFCHENRILDYKFYVLFTYREPETNIKKLFWFWPFGNKKKSIKKETVALIRDIGLRSRAFIGALKQAGVEAIQLNKDGIKDVLEAFLNPLKPVSRPVSQLEDSFTEFKGLLARTPLAESHDKVMLGKEYIKTVYISDIPETAGALQNLFFKNNCFTASIFAKGISQQDIKIDLKNKLKLARGTGGGVADVENKEIASAANELLSMQTRGDIKFIKFACYLSFKHENLDTLEEITPEFESVFQDGTMFEGLFEQKNLWASTVPLLKNRADHYFLTLSGSAAGISGGLSNLFPFFNFETDNSEGGVLLGTSATGQPVLYNPWSKKLINGNHIIMGQPGSGKSFYVNLVLNRLSPWKPEVIIIDKSKSYEMLCNCNKGQYIKIGLGGENSYNVFDCIDYDPELGEDNDINDKGEPTAGKISFITGLFDIILAEEGEKRLNKLDSSLVEKIIKLTYKENLKVKDGEIDKKTMPTLGSVTKTIEKMIKNHENENWKIDLAKIKEKLGPFVGDGTYAPLLDKPSNIELKSHFIVFDISNLPDRDDIQSLAVYIISSFSMQRFKINKKLGKRQILCIDEAWYLARFSGGRSFLLELAKRSRHLGLMVMIATQQIGDFLGQPEAAQVLKSAPTMTLFGQSSTDIDHLGVLLGLNGTEKKILSGLYQERGKYSQAFYISGQAKNTIFVRPDAVLRWIATSEPTYDVPARNAELEKTNFEAWKAVKNLVGKGA